MNELWHENPSFGCLCCECENHKACWCPWCGTGTYDSECLVLTTDD